MDISKSRDSYLVGMMNVAVANFGTSATTVGFRSGKKHSVPGSGFSENEEISLTKLHFFLVNSHF